MHRRDFLSAFGKGPLATATLALASTAVARGRDVKDSAYDGVNQQMKALRSRMDKVEGNQKKMLKALLVLTAVSTGIDLSLVL